MNVIYENLLELEKQYNALLYEKEQEVLCYVSGKSMFAKDIVLSEDAHTQTLYEYFQGNSFVMDIVTIAREHKVPISKLIAQFIETSGNANGLNIEEDAKELIRLFSYFHFVSVTSRLRKTYFSVLQLLRRLNTLFWQWGYGLYAELDEQKLADMEPQGIVPFEYVFERLEELEVQTAQEKQIPLVYARIHCCKTMLHELGVPECIEIREYQNRFLKKNLNYLTVSLTKFVLQQGGKCYFEFSEYKIEKLAYNAAELYHWLIATGKKMREVPRGKMTFWFSYQMYLDESKDTLLSVLRLEPNMLGAAKYYMESREADYKYILEMLKEMKQLTVSNADSNNNSVIPETETAAAKGQEVKKPISEDEDKYGEVLRNIQNKLDDMMNVVIEHSVLTIDGLEKVNTNVEAIHAEVQGVSENLEEVKTEVLARFDELQNQLEQCIERNDTEGLSELLEKKINLIKQLQQTDYPDVVMGEDIYFLLAFLHTKKPEQMMKELFSYLKNGEYKTKYEEKISQNNNIIYSAECALGKVVLYRKDGITYLKNLQIRQEYLPDNVIRFLEKYGTKERAKVFFDDRIYEELDRLMKGTKQSFHMIMPWVKDWRLNTYEARFGKMLQSGVDVHIKYGYLSKGSDEAQNQVNERKLAESKKALETLNEELGKRFGSQIQIKEDDTHIKAAVVDRRWCFVGSCNILSYHYDYHKNPDYRHEMMVLLEDEELAQVLMKYCEGTIHDVK